MAFSPDLVTSWRIVKSAYAASAFDGEGARIAGGRWTSPGRRAAYTAESISLAALEMLVHLGSSAVLAQYVVIPCSFPRRFITTIDRAMLHADWRMSPPLDSLRRIGDQWLTRKTTAVLSVPSAVINGERNYLLNPEHTDFAAIEFDRPRSFAFDPRLWWKN